MEHNGEQNGRRIAIIGGGIAGLCAAVYGLKCGYQVEVLEMHDMAGGLAMSWRRGGYTFETCLHWLFGSKPGADLHAQWQEIFDIERLTFVNPDEFLRIEDENGDSLNLYSDVDRLEAELLRCAPQDAAAIRDMTRDVRSLSKFKMLDPSGGLADNWLNLLRDAPIFPSLARLSKITSREYGSRFSDPRLRSFFGEGEMGKLSAIAMIFSLAWRNGGNAGYPIGGSQAMIRLIEEKIASLGGKIRFGARVERILVEHGAAVGVALEDGTSVMADWVISAADGHSTIFEMLGGKYLNPGLTKAYERDGTVPFVSAGVSGRGDGPERAATDGNQAAESATGSGSRHKAQSSVVPLFQLRPDLCSGGQDSGHVFSSDEQLFVLDRAAPEQSCRIQGRETPCGGGGDRDSGQRVCLRSAGHRGGGCFHAGLCDPLYRQLERKHGGVADCAGHRGQAAAEYSRGLRRFLMVGQWVMPGGGLPSGPMTARPALKAICKEDHVPFNLHAKDAVKPEPVAV